MAYILIGLVIFVVCSILGAIFRGAGRFNTDIVTILAEQVARSTGKDQAVAEAIVRIIARLVIVVLILAVIAFH